MVTDIHMVGSKHEIASEWERSLLHRIEFRFSTVYTCTFAELPKIRRMPELLLGFHLNILYVSLLCIFFYICYFFYMKGIHTVSECT